MEVLLNNQSSLTELVDRFVKKGGKVNRFYLSNPLHCKQTLVYLNGWFSGKNVKEAIEKALSSKI
jgi:hypothetical protein